MITYTKEEMIGITELGKSLGSYLDKITSHSFDKIAITRRNKPEAVIVPIDEYERMKESADILEAMQIAEVIKERVTERKEPAEMISHEDMKKFLNEKGCDV